MKQHNWTRWAAVALVTAVASTGAFAQFKLKKIPKEEMEEIISGQRTKTFPAPENVAAVPDEAELSDSGIHFMVTREGHGETVPKDNDAITVHYTGWMADGRLFDTTRGGREPRRMQLNKAAPALVEHFSQMRVGERRRIWIPEDLADQFRNPELEGHVVFDLELLNLEPAPSTPEHYATAPDHSTKTATGLAYETLRAGRGEDSPTPADLALLHFNAWDTNGKLTFSTERDGKAPQSVIISDLMPGLQEALSTMKVGELRRVWVPTHLTRIEGLEKFLQQPQVVELELLSFISDPAEIGKAIAEPPQDALATDNGLRYQVLREGAGSEHPAINDTIVVHYSVWNAAGDLLDSSFKAGKPYALPLDDRLPQGWRDTVSAMVPGEKRRVWIPAELGFQQYRNVDAGDLIFEVDLLKIEGSDG